MAQGTGHRNRAGRQPPRRLSSGRCVQHGKEGAALRHGIRADLQTGWCGTSDTGTPGDGGERRLPEGRWPHHGLVKGATVLGL